MQEQAREPLPADDGFVTFPSAGSSAKGEYHCAHCGYGVTVSRALPLCPMCGGKTWEQSSWSPFRSYTH